MLDDLCPGDDMLMLMIARRRRRERDVVDDGGASREIAFLAFRLHLAILLQLSIILK